MHATPCQTLNCHIHAFWPSRRLPVAPTLFVTRQCAVLCRFNSLHQALDRTIILFDEIEEFCLDRDNPALGMESRLLTTAMLTQV